MAPSRDMGTRATGHGPAGRKDRTHGSTGSLHALGPSLRPGPRHPLVVGARPFSGFTCDLDWDCNGAFHKGHLPLLSHPLPPSSTRRPLVLRAGWFCWPTPAGGIRKCRLRLPPYSSYPHQTTQRLIRPDLCTWTLCLSPRRPSSVAWGGQGERPGLFAIHKAVKIRSRNG